MQWLRQRTMYFCAWTCFPPNSLIASRLFRLSSFGSPRRRPNHDAPRLGGTFTDDLIERTVPGAIRLRERLSVSKALTESEYLEHIDGLASQNTVFRTTSAWAISHRSAEAFAGMCWRTRDGTRPTRPTRLNVQGRLSALNSNQVMDLTG